MRTILLVLTATTLLACAGAPFNASGYKHPTHPLAVRYHDAGAKVFISKDWRIDNYILGEHGAPMVAKDGDDYKIVRNVDFDGDGVPDRQKVHRFELKLVHRSNDSVIWMRLIPLAKGDEGLELRVFVDRYVEALTGTGFFAEDLPSGKAKARAQRFAAKVLDVKSRTLGQVEALQADIELANVDQLRLDPASRHAKIRVIFARPGFADTVQGSVRFDIQAPVLVAVGFFSGPGTFDGSVRDFESFVGAVELGKR